MVSGSLKLFFYLFFYNITYIITYITEFLHLIANTLPLYISTTGMFERPFIAHFDGKEVELLQRPPPIEEPVISPR